MKKIQIAGAPLPELAQMLAAAQPQLRARAATGQARAALRSVFHKQPATPLQLPSAFAHTAPTVRAVQRSRDGTCKWLVHTASGHTVESVFIPTAGRGTLCISSQAGCTLACKFCHTGTQVMAGNLTAADITAQVLAARWLLGQGPEHAVRSDAHRFGELQSKAALSNIVFMGQGEPLFNSLAVHRAIEVLTHADAGKMSRRSITVSSSGVAPKIPKLADAGVNLAVSLHSAVDATRSKIMDINSRWPLAQLQAAVAEYLST